MTMTTTLKKRDISIDWIKFFCVFLIINSHSDIMYPKFSMLATGGSIGDCLFLFVSGYTLWLNRTIFPSFANWYKRRINRIYPTVIVWLMVAGWLGFKDVSCKYMLIWGGDFVNFIMIYYALLYVVRKYAIKHLSWVYVGWTVMVLLFYWLWFPYKYEVSERGMYGITTHFRWLPYFLFMMMGAHIGQIRSSIKFCFKKDIMIFILCLIVFYSFQLMSKKYSVIAPYQIFTLLPLAGIVFYFYKICNADLLKRLYSKKWIKAAVLTVGGLCLESYLIQFSIITDKLNFLFPLNLPLVAIAVLIVGYIVRCGARFFAQTFDSKEYDWKAIVKLY